jgi:hypothetical protein
VMEPHTMVTSAITTSTVYTCQSMVGLGEYIWSDHRKYKGDWR